MNKVFKIIWNNVTQSFVVVSELARNRGKLSSEMKKSNVVNLFKLSIFTMCMMGGASQVQAKFAQGGIPDSNVSATSIAIADANSTATAANSITMGNSAQNPYQAGIVLGYWAGAKGSTSGGYNVIIGGNAQVGTKAQAVNQSIAIGAGGGEANANLINGAWAKGDQSIAIGGNTRSDGNSSIAIGGDDLDRAGSKSYTGADKFIDYDKNGNKTGEYTLNNKALRDIYNKMTGDTMINGVYANTVSGEASVALGVQSEATADLSTALGTKSKATAFGSVALGVGAKANKLNSVAIGTASKTDEEGRAYATRTILGETYTWAGGATVDAGDVVSFGSKGYERQLINVAPGDISSNSTDAINGSQLYGVLSSLEKIRYFSVKSSVAQNRNNDGARATDAIAIGPNASSTADRGIAMGLNSQASQPNTISLGWNAKTSAVNSIALGTNANASGINALAFGTNAIGSRDNTIAMGGASSASGDSSMAFGLSSNASGGHSIAIGEQSNAAVEHSVALGSHSQAGANAFDATSSTATFKDAAGADTTIRFAANSSTMGGAVSVGKAGEERQIHNVAAGRISATSTDAINGSQLHAVLNNSGFNVQENGSPKSRINNNDVVNFKDGNLTTANVTKTPNGTIVKFDVNTTNITTDATTGNATATNPNNIATAGDVTSAINKVRNMPITFTGNSGSAVKKLGESLGIVGDGTDITSTADASNVTFTLNKSTAVTAGDNKAVTSGAVDTAIKAINLTTAGNTGAGAVNLATQSLNITGSNGLTTVAKDNGIEVKIDDETRQKIDREVSASVSNGSAAVSVTANGTTKNADGVDVTDYAVDLSQATKDDIQKGVDANTTVTTKGLTFTGTTGSTTAKKLGESVEISGDDNITTEATADKVQIKLKKDITVDSVTAGDTKIDKNGLKAGDVTVTNAPITVNGAPVNNVNEAINKTAKQAFSPLTFAGDTGTNVTRKLGETVNLVGGVTDAAKLSDGNIGVVADGTDKLDIKLAKDIKVDSVKAGDTIINNDGLTVNGGPSVTKSGVNAGNKKISNVADGEVNGNSKDAVNGSQLYSLGDTINKKIDGMGFNLTTNG
ncbi:MAG: ESPR-type extended signal peptide-containing protein, partial [Haemophilus parainfluenzae]|nr:ESPR-type extended signal peptide-containing protein [Haemophilus parainfluenzae]